MNYKFGTITSIKCTGTIETSTLSSKRPFLNCIHWKSFNIDTNFFTLFEISLYRTKINKFSVNFITTQRNRTTTVLFIITCLVYKFQPWVWPARFVPAQRMVKYWNFIVLCKRCITINKKNKNYLFDTETCNSIYHLWIITQIWRPKKLS